MTAVLQSRIVEVGFYRLSYKILHRDVTISNAVPREEVEGFNDSYGIDTVSDIW
jgi:hypothetical protein